jgi:hypothetical protein
METPEHLSGPSDLAAHVHPPYRHMSNWVAVAAVVWLILIGGVIFLAMCRICAAMEDAGLDIGDPLHLHLRHVIQFSDRVGISLTITAFALSVILASMLVRILSPQ